MPYTNLLWSAIPYFDSIMEYYTILLRSTPLWSTIPYSDSDSLAVFLSDSSFPTFYSSFGVQTPTPVWSTIPNSDSLSVFFSDSSCSTICSGCGVQHHNYRMAEWEMDFSRAFTIFLAVRPNGRDLADDFIWRNNRFLRRGGLEKYKKLWVYVIIFAL